MLIFPKDKKKQIRFFILLDYVLIACVFVLLFRPVYLYSIMIVLVPPTILNFIWLKKSKYKILMFSLASTIIFAPPVELMLRLVNAWDVQSILPRFMEVIPIENLIFAFINFFWVLSFYEYFVDRDVNSKISKMFKYLIDIFVFFDALVLIIYRIDPRILTLNYFGAALLILVIPAVFIFAKNTHLLKKCILPTVFFAVIFFVYEIVSLYIGSWWWPGDYYLPVLVFGKVFPLDDVLIWYFMSTPALIGGYEYFMDDDK